jgi:hypothetical protein
MISRIAVILLFSSLALFQGSTAVPRPMPTLTVVPLVPSVLEAAFRHVRSYKGDFTLNYQGSGETKYERADVTLHLSRSYEDAGDHGTEMLWSGYGFAHATYSSADCSSSGTAPQGQLLVELFEDLGRHIYRLNTYSVAVSCKDGPLQIGGFSSTPVTILPSPYAVICGTMTVVAPGDFTEHDNWSFTPAFDNNATVVHPKCAQVAPLPDEEQ